MSFGIVSGYGEQVENETRNELRMTEVYSISSVSWWEDKMIQIEG
jgi:hypothetical protein